MELTAVDVGGEPWWTLGFEATGPADALRRELDAAAALVFADALQWAILAYNTDTLAVRSR